MSNALSKARRDYTDAVKADKPKSVLNAKRKKLNIEILKIKTKIQHSIFITLCICGLHLFKTILLLA